MRFGILLFIGTTTAQAEDVKGLIDPPAQKLLGTVKKSGFVVGIYVGGKSHVYGYGTVKLAGGPATPNGATIFEIGSITKTFTGVLLADAVHRGEVTLDRPAQNHLPADVPLPKAADTPITLEHLATHRSGLPVIPLAIGLLSAEFSNPYADFDRKKLQQSLGLIKPDAPGEKYRYSNLGAGIAGIALVHSTKARSYDALVKDRIATPLKMYDTAEALTGAQRARFARGCNEKGEPTSTWDFACLEACGGLRSTVDDMLLFAAANLGDSKSELYPRMQESHKPRAAVRGEQAKIGLFWHITQRRDGPLIWHNGGTGGYRAMLALIPKTKTAVVVLCAASQEDVDAYALEMLQAIQPKP